MVQCMILLHSRRTLGFVLTSSKRQFSTVVAVIPAEEDSDVPYAYQHLTSSIPYPKSLSPSSIMEFQKCPQSFLFQYLWGIRQPTTPVLAKGTMCHAALEQIFDLEPADRTLENLQNLYRKEWSIQKHKSYKSLFLKDDEWNVADEREWGLSGLRLLQNYVQLEDPRRITRPNPVQREVWVKANLNVSGRRTDGSPAASGPDDTFLVRGIVDRLDMIQHPGDRQVYLRLVDYKSGKAPQFKYSPSMNAKIAEETFFQLKIYALLLRESNSERTGLDLRTLRLLHLTSENNDNNDNDTPTEGPALYLDYDLGATAEERNAILDGLYETLADTWTQIRVLVETQDPLQFHGCDRSFCWCHKCRPQFLPGSVWEPKEGIANDK